MTVLVFLLWIAAGLYVLVCLARPLPPFETRKAALAIAVPVLVAITLLLVFMTRDVAFSQSAPWLAPEAMPTAPGR